MITLQLRKFLLFPESWLQGLHDMFYVDTCQRMDNFTPSNIGQQITETLGYKQSKQVYEHGLRVVNHDSRLENRLQMIIKMLAFHGHASCNMKIRSHDDICKI